MLFIKFYFNCYVYSVTELLVRAGASVNVSDLWKFTPLHEAAAKGTLRIHFILNYCVL